MWSCRKEEVLNCRKCHLLGLHPTGTPRYGFEQQEAQALVVTESPAVEVQYRKHGAFQVYYQTKEGLSPADLLFRELWRIMGNPPLYLTSAIKCAVDPHLGQHFKMADQCRPFLSSERKERDSLPTLLLGSWASWSFLTVSERRDLDLGIFINFPSTDQALRLRISKHPTLNTYSFSLPLEKIPTSMHPSVVEAFRFLWSQS